MKIDGGSQNLKKWVAKQKVSRRKGNQTRESWAIEGICNQARREYFGIRLRLWDLRFLGNRPSNFGSISVLSTKIGSLVGENGDAYKHVDRRTAMTGSWCVSICIFANMQKNASFFHILNRWRHAGCSGLGLPPFLTLHISSPNTLKLILQKLAMLVLNHLERWNS